MTSVGSFEASDGVTIRYHHSGPVEADSSGAPPVVLVHGFAGDSRSSWIDPGTMDALVRAGREVIAVDTRGHGLSDTPHDSTFYGETRMSRDLVELWDSLELDELDLVGHSMGAVVALITGGDARIRRLVLSGIGGYQVAYDGGPLPHFDSAGFASALSADDPDDLTEPELREFRDDIDESGNDRLALAAHLRVFHTDPFDFAAIAVPTLVIAGEDDELSPEPERLAAALTAGRAVTVAGDHAGAKLTPAFVEAVMGFLDA